MATVRFSKELSDAILRNAKAVFGNRMQSAHDSAPKEWGDRLYETIFARYIPSLNALPLEYFNTADSFRFAGFDIDGMNISFDMPLSTKRPFPLELPSDLKHIVKKSGYSSNEYKLKDIPEFAEFKQLVVDWKERCNKVTEQRSQFVESVSKVISAHTTLAPALKMWPPLWDLVPEQYKERHREVKDREKREVSVNVDLIKMTAVATAAKIGGM